MPNPHGRLSRGPCKAQRRGPRLARRAGGDEGSKNNSGWRGNNWWVSNLDSFTRVQEPRLADPPRNPSSGEFRHKRPQCRPRWGRFFYLRDQEGKAVQRVNEGHPARWRSVGLERKRPPTGGGIMWRGWYPMIGIHRTCKCGAVYDRSEHMVEAREISSFECAVCGKIIENWNSAWVPRFRFIACPAREPE